MQELNEQSFKEQVLDHKGVAIVDFWASWCGPCKQFGPAFEEASTKAPKGVHFGKVNVDDQGQLAQQYGVMSIPTCIIFKDGKPVDQFSGARPADHVVQAVLKHTA